MQWTRTKQWAAVGILVVAATTTMVTAGTAGARGDGRWPASLPAQVNLDSVAQCVQRMNAERLTRLVGAHLDGLPIEVDEPTLHFHVWDALVATCRDHARDYG
jgi:hypothetical protein